MLRFQFSHKNQQPERNLQCRQPHLSMEFIFITAAHIADTCAASWQIPKKTACLLFLLASTAPNAPSHSNLTKVLSRKPKPLFPTLDAISDISTPTGALERHNDHCFYCWHWRFKFADTDHMPPGNLLMPILWVMSTHTQPYLNFAQTHPFFLMPQPRNRATVMHQHHITYRAYQVSPHKQHISNRLLLGIARYFWQLKYIWSQQLQIHPASSRYPVCSPLRYSLRRDNAQPRHLIRTTQLVDNVGIIHARIKAHFKSAGQAYFKYK